MRTHLIRVAGVLAAALIVTGCTMSQAREQHRRELLTQRIVDDAIAYNEAYSGAISGQILLNILRAYDRQPRQYMSMSGFTNADPDSRGLSVGVSDLPLGQLGREWGAGALGLSATTTLEPEYNVEPFAAEAYSRVVMEPATRDAFAHYWNTGWSRDVLLLLLVREVQVTPLPRGARRVFINHAATIRANCGGATVEDNAPGCAFVTLVRELAQTTFRAGSLAVDTPQGPNSRPICGLIGAYGESPPVHRAADPDSGPCSPSIVADGAIYTFSLRSLDGMIYYIGELLRSDPALATETLHAPWDDAMLARVSIAPPGLPSGVPSVPIFRVLPAERAEGQFAARATYGGRQFVAGPPVSRLCDASAPSGACADDVEHGDRSSTVIEFLAGILAFNQSERAVSAPQPRQ